MIKLENGLAARITHLRTIETPSPDGSINVRFGPRKYTKGEKPLDNKPTRTIAEIFDGKQLVSTGEACTKKEQFNRVKGRKIAIGRALHNLYTNTNYNK